MGPVTGPTLYYTVTDTMTEIVVPFWKATLVARDQNGANAAGAQVNVIYVGGPFAPGTAVTLPKGYTATVYGQVPNMSGPAMYFTFTDGLVEVDPGFMKVTVQCREAGGAITPSGREQLRFVYPDFFADGANVIVPKGSTISTLSSRVNLYADTYDNTVFSSSLTTLSGKFMSVQFRALDAGGALIQGATIDIYTSGIAQFANGTSQILPYPDTIRVRVWKDGVVIKDVNNVTVTSQIVVSKVEIATGVGIDKGVLDIETGWSAGQQVTAPAQTEVAFSDDFNSGDLAGWVVKGGSWSAETGVLVKDAAPATEQVVEGDGVLAAEPVVVEEGGLVSESPVDLEGYALRFAARAEGEGSIGVTFAETDDGNCLRLVWNTDGMVLEKVEGGVATTIASNSFALELGGTYDLAASVASGQLTVSVDGDAVLTTDIGTAVGKVGLYTSGNGIAIFDDVAVERPVANVPADNGTRDNGGDNTTPVTTTGGSSGGGGCFVETASVRAGER
jgi:hypothetical protein